MWLLGGRRRAWRRCVGNDTEPTAFSQQTAPSLKRSRKRLRTA